jgi:hypothetical protein
VKRAGSHFEIIRLMDHTTLIGPIAVEGENQVLEGHKRSILRGLTAAVNDRSGECQANKKYRESQAGQGARNLQKDAVERTVGRPFDDAVARRDSSPVEPERFIVLKLDELTLLLYTSLP